MHGTVVLVGASVRAIAQSARRMGWRVIAIDLFGDEDLRSIADKIHVVPWDDYPDGMGSILEQYPNLPVAYTGSIENNLSLIASLERLGTLWGNQPGVVRRVRDLVELHRVLSSHGFRAPRTLHAPRDADTATGWLAKARRSAGGMQVKRWTGERLEPDEYLQEYIEGKACSSLYLGDGHDSYLLGSTRQILSRDQQSSHAGWLEEKPFQYIGSIGPISLEDHFRATRRSWSILGREFGLRGLFGVDWIDAQGDLVIIEVNPRYPASAEVIKESMGESLFRYHSLAFTKQLSRNSISLPRVSASPGLAGKRIVFAPNYGTFSRAPCYQSVAGSVGYADIPAVDTRIPKGFPVLTLFSRGQEEESLREELQKKSHHFLREFFVASSSAKCTTR